MGTRQSTMDTERLTAMDHLEPIQSPTPEEQGGEVPMLPAPPGARGVTGTSGPYEAVTGGSRLVSVGHLQSEGLRKLLLDGIVITLIYFVVGIIWLMTTCQWGFTATVYFMVISVVTVGYGDITVGRKASDRVLDSLLIVIGLAALSTWATYAARVLEFRRLRAESLQCVSSTGMQPAAAAGDTVVGERRWLFGAVLGMAGIICVGMVVFMLGEDTDMATGFYWAVVTASTIGYGDVVPTTFAMRWFTVFYVVVAAMWMVETLRMVGTFPFTLWTRQAEAKVHRQFDVPNTAQEQDRVEELMRRALVQTIGVSPEREGSVSRSEFAIGMLMLLDRISYKEYLEAATVYDKLKSRESAGIVRATPSEPSEKR